MQFLSDLIGKPAEFVALAKELGECDPRGFCIGPGKFEGEHVAALYFWECTLNGFGEHLCGNNCFDLDNGEREAFEIDVRFSHACVEEDANGFVYLTLLTPTDYGSLREEESNQ